MTKLEDMMESGCMIVCDGGNGAGKSTVLKAIEAHLFSKGYELEMTREPGGTPISERIREILLDRTSVGMCDITELLLFAASRAQHVHERIIPALRSGKVVVSDRFNSATVSFQHFARGLPFDLISRLNSIAIGDFKPAITIILDLDPKVGLERVASRGDQLDRMEEENMEFLQKARHGYLEQARQDAEHFAVIDSSQSLENVVKEAISIVDRTLAGRALLRKTVLSN